MNRLRWTPAAAENLHAISLYLERQRGLTLANEVCRSIYEAVQQLRSFAVSGRPGKEPGTREFVIPDLPMYIVVYRLAPGDMVELLSIWHGAQKPASYSRPRLVLFRLPFTIVCGASEHRAG